MAKKAMSAYWLWLSENRVTITKEHGLEGKRGSEVSKKASELWKAIDEATKKKYAGAAAARTDDRPLTAWRKRQCPRICSGSARTA